MVQTESPGAEGRQLPFDWKRILTISGVLVGSVVAVVVGAYYTCGFEGCPNINEVRGYVPDEASAVVDRDGVEVGKLFRVNRVIIGLDSLPEHVVQAFVATEDRSFYRHGGVDWGRVGGAAWRNLRRGGIAEGFSTITMQVARNIFPERLPLQERTLRRKLAEVKVARQLERRYEKDDILQLYLNQIYFGSGAWGIQAAAREYFGKSATDLTLAESALLAGLPQAPSRLNPRVNMEGAIQRRGTVLRRMVAAGFITEDEAAAVAGTEPRLARSSLHAPERAAYLMEHVRQLAEERLGDRLYTEGFTIHTTLDLAVQEVVERELLGQLRAIEGGRYGYYPHNSYAATIANGAVGTRPRSPYLQGAAIVMSVRSGDILALVGGRDFEDSKFNRAVQARRQPGSAFKPFVYAAAVQAGHPPTRTLEDTPYRLVQDGRVWEPRNYDGTFAGPITMRQALTQSRNVATIRLAEEVGLGRVVDLARSAGITDQLPPYPSVAIGAAEVTLLDMVTAYSTFAALGDRPEPRFIMRITDRHGVTVWQQSTSSRHVLSSDVAFLTIDLMRDVVDRGTGTAVRAAGFRGAAAGKTGTTNESADVWFIGSTPEVTTGIWIGLDEPRRVMARATGGRLAAPVWGRIMRQVAPADGSWSPPPGIETHMVDEFGNVVAANCPSYGPLREEYFLRGTVHAYSCRDDYLWTYRDDDSLYHGIDEDSWWRRLRERVLRDDQRRDTLRIDAPPARSDTIILRTGPDTVRLPPTPPDTRRRPLGRDTVLPDRPPATRRPPRDTIPQGSTPRLPGGSR